MKKSEPTKPSEPTAPFELSAPVSRRRFLLGATGAVVVAGVSTPMVRAAANTAISGSSELPVCSPFGTTPSFRGIVPTPQSVLGFPLGSQEVTAAESSTYIDSVAAASDQVVAGTYGASVQGRPLRYAIVGRPANVTPAGLAAIQAATAQIRDPGTDDATVQALATTTPAILWVIANIHGNEESGCDAALQILYELADRDDCAADQILDNAIVVIIPTQNPDGREAGTRRNANGFDLNRDMFARTQPETDTKIELMRQFPPLALVDGHEFGYYQAFFPPNNDPIYAEVSRESVSWINDRYGPAMSAAFRDRGWGFFHGKVYDFFSPEFNDTVATNGFLGGGMTIEVYSGRPINERFLRHYTIDWMVLSVAALTKSAILRQHHRAAVEALDEGKKGELEPNRRIFNPHKPVRMKVPDRPVRHYFFVDEPAKSRETQLLVRRLQRMNVQVYRLNSPIQVPDFKPYGRAAGKSTLAAGTYWVPMAQPQKHWIQMQMNENTYPPTIYTYGLFGWSSPLLMNLDGGASGAKLHPSASLVPPVAEPPGPALGTPGSIGVFQISNGVYAEESAGAARWLFDSWGLPYTKLEAADIAAGGLVGLDVLVAPGGGANPALRRLGAAGVDALVSWVNAGGRYVGYRYGGARLAALTGLTTTLVSNPRASINGSLVRARVDPSSPLADGVGSFVWVLFDDDLVLRVRRASMPVRYPSGDGAGGDFFISGYGTGQEDLFGTAAVSDERVGAGRVVLFGSDPAFRGQTEGTERLLLNAVVGPNPAAASASTLRRSVSSGEDSGLDTRALLGESKRAAEAIAPFDSWMSLIVSTGERNPAAGLLSALGADFRVVSDLDRGRLSRFLIDNPGEYSLEEHPWALELLIRLGQQGVEVQGFSEG